MLIIVDLRIHPRKLCNDDFIFKIHIANPSFKSTSRKYFAKAKFLGVLCFQENKAELFSLSSTIGLELRSMTRTRDLRLGLGSRVRAINLAVLTVVTLAI